jgi:hypothetical protein
VPTSVPTPVPSLALKELCPLLKIGGFTTQQLGSRAQGLYTRWHNSLSEVVYKQYNQPNLPAAERGSHIRGAITSLNHYHNIEPSDHSIAVDRGQYYMWFNEASNQWVVRRTSGPGLEHWDSSYLYKDGKVGIDEGPYEGMTTESKSPWTLKSAGDPFTGAFGLKEQTKMFVRCLKAPSTLKSAFKVFGHGELVTWIKANSTIPLGTVGRVAKLSPDGHYVVKFRIKHRHKALVLKDVAPESLQHALTSTSVGGY